ncbi:hypothetical protein KR009_002042, partial [Drosophila setifemur]
KMKRSNTEIGIFSLNIYCLGEIFRHIQLNCLNCNKDIDINPLIRYLDLINFAISCESLTKAFKDWSPQLFRELRIEHNFLKRTPWIEIDFSDIYNNMQYLGLRAKKDYWKAYINTIKDNDQLQSLKLNYEQTKCDAENSDRLGELVNAVQDKSTLKELVIKRRGYSFENVPKFGNLEILHLDARMYVSDLILLCQSNPGLRCIKLGSSELYGRLSDIWPHCTQLESLTFVMKQGQDAGEFAPLARLPNNEVLTIKGVHEEGTLIRLFQGLKEKQIRKICIPNAYVTNEEAFALAEIRSMVSLKCSLLDNSIYGDLPLSGNLTEVCILSYPNLLDTGEDITDYEEIQGKTHLKLSLRPDTKLVNIPEANNYQWLQTKESSVLLKSWEQEYALAHRLRCEGWFYISFLAKTFQITSQSGYMVIEKLVLYQREPITQEDVELLATIPTITTIRCYFRQMHQMIAVKIFHMAAISEMENRVDRIKTEKCEVHLIHSQNSVTLVLDIYADTIIKARKFAPLFNLKNLKCLKIRGDLWDPFVFAREMQDLQELEVDIVKPAELPLLSLIGSLKVLKCGFFCSENIEHLAELDQLESLTITVHPQGSLRTLFKSLAFKENQKLRKLIVQRTGLTAKEIYEVASIKSLESLQLGLPDSQRGLQTSDRQKKYMNIRYCPKCSVMQSELGELEHRTFLERVISSEPDKAALLYQMHLRPDVNFYFNSFKLEHLASLPHLQDLSINFEYTTKDVEKLLRNIARQNPKKLQKLSIASQRFELISQFENLKSLRYGIYYIQDIQNAASLRNISELQIHNCLDADLWEFLKELEILSGLQCLLLNNADLGFLDLVEISKLTWLKHLRLGLADKKFIFMLVHLKDLEYLEITSKHFADENQVNFVLSYLVSCKKLRHLSLNRFYRLLTVPFVNVIMGSIKFFRDPEQHPPLKLSGVWCDFKRVNELDRYNEDYIKLERPNQQDYQSSDESDED